MFKYKLTEKKYTPGGFKVGDTKTQKGRKSTVTDVDPVTLLLQISFGEKLDSPS